MTLMQVATEEVVTADRETGIREVLRLMDEYNVGSVIIAEEEEPVGIVTDRMIALASRDVDAVTDVSAADAMTDELVTISDDVTHFDALEAMSEAGIRRLPIVDEDGTLVGIITLDDLLIVIAAEMTNAAEIISRQATPL